MGIVAWHILDQFALDSRCAYGGRQVVFASANRLAVSSTHKDQGEKDLVSKNGLITVKASPPPKKFRWLTPATMT